MWVQLEKGWDAGVKKIGGEGVGGKKVLKMGG